VATAFQEVFRVTPCRRSYGLRPSVFDDRTVARRLERWRPRRSGRSPRLPAAPAGWSPQRFLATRCCCPAARTTTTTVRGDLLLLVTPW